MSAKIEATPPPETPATTGHDSEPDMLDAVIANATANKSFTTQAKGKTDKPGMLESIYAMVDYMRARSGEVEGQKTESGLPKEFVASSDAASKAAKATMMG